MDMNIDNIAALIARFAIAIVYFFVFRYFFTGYKKSKESGYTNNFFLGNSVLFAILSIFNLGYGGYELYKSLVDNPFSITNHFPWYVQSDDFLLDLMSNQMRPMFLIFYFVMSIVFVAQVYPLEKAIGWNKTPFAKTILILGSLNWLMFIPPLSNTYVSVITVVSGFAALIFGVALNIGVNLKLFKSSVGNLRTQSFYAFLAFFILAIGLAISMELGWIPGISYRWEVVIGCIMQLFAALLYKKAFILGTME